MPTQVCITIDTEFNIGGALGNPQYEPIAEHAVWFDVEGKSEGLGFLLRCLKKYNIVGTFFVETMNRHYFKHDPMKSIARQISDEGHEVQLHSHPCWSIFQNLDWQQRSQKAQTSDHFFARSEDESLKFIQQGIETFRDWGIPSPQVFRSGNLEHDDSLFRALSRSGIPYSSNIGLQIFNSGDLRYQLYAGCHERHGVLEFPILTFNDWRIGGRQHLKSLTITGTSFAETRTLLEQAEGAGIEQVVILTHPSEFVQTRDFRYNNIRRHGVNQRRLTELCQFLDQNKDRFPASGLNNAAKKYQRRERSPNPLLKGLTRQSAVRMANQFLYDRYGRLSFALGNKA
jgi:peptidoglycan/xylan/chitin deacetylase (PgdA/CDA1 family)